MNQKLWTHGNGYSDRANKENVKLRIEDRLVEKTIDGGIRLN